MRAVTPGVRRLTVVWVLLSVLTVVSWVLTPHGGSFRPSTGVTIAVVLIAAVKMRFVLRDFMDVRHAPVWLRAGTDAWLVALWAAVLVIYVLGS
jgi:heme/copper-type cytochrome/quinol oxidase subunit 4